MVDIIVGFDRVEVDDTSLTGDDYDSFDDSEEEDSDDDDSDEGDEDGGEDMNDDA